MRRRVSLAEAIKQCDAVFERAQELRRRQRMLDRADLYADLDDNIIDPPITVADQHSAYRRYTYSATT